jgi:hypothetical protein
MFSSTDIPIVQRQVDARRDIIRYLVLDHCFLVGYAFGYQTPGNKRQRTRV